MAKQKKIDLEHMTEKEKMKYEIADELGLLQFNRIKQVLYFNCEKQSVVGWDLLVSGVIQAF